MHPYPDSGKDIFLSVEFEVQPPKLGLLNLMPAATREITEEQWRAAFSDNAEMVPVTFDDDPRDMKRPGVGGLHLYHPFSQTADSLDGLIITGANLERRPDGLALPYSDISYIDQLREVMAWAEDSSRLTIFSCLASHIALDHLYGLPRQVRKEKTFGVFCHDVRVESDITKGLEHPIRAPHSRWGNIPAHVLTDAGVEVLLEGFEPGWLLAESRSQKGRNIFIQGHPEYDRHALHREYMRDQTRRKDLPLGYYPGNDPACTPNYTWGGVSARLFSNLASTLLVENSLANVGS